MENDNQIKSTKVRSSSYPYVGLEHAIKLCEDLRRAVGKGPYSRDSASRGIGHESLSGPAAAKIAALVYFGLLDRHGNTYSVSPLADRIQFPVDEDDKISAIKEAVQKPKLYKQLIEKYKNQSLPTLLDNILTREFGIYEKKARGVSKNFKRSLEYAEMLNNGVITDQLGSGVVLSSEETRPPLSVLNSTRENVVLSRQSSEYFELPTGIKILFPEHLKYYVALGSFSEGIQALNKKAEEILKELGIKDSKP